MLQYVSSGLPVHLSILFLAILLWVLINNPGVLMKRHGRRHAIMGFCYLSWLLVGYAGLVRESPLVDDRIYDVVLGVLGTVLTLTAAFDFQHKNVKNVASGTLDEHATVTYGEMIEHSFYQGLNLVQAVYFHSIAYCDRTSSESWIRLVLLFFVTYPWLLRDFFPVNKFSDNYNKMDEKSTAFIRFLYRIKKYQYVFYKHFLLHGLNISLLAVTASSTNAGVALSLVDQPYFRLYWILLNTSYVMEFFLQTLVKKQYLSQSTMLWLQKILMLASSIAAVRVLTNVNLVVALVSMVSNFVHRKHDVVNTCIIAGVYYWYLFHYQN